MEHSFLLSVSVFLAASILVVPLIKLSGLGSVIGYLVALAFLAIWLLMITPRLFARVSGWKSRTLLFAGLCALPLCIWLVRASIPAAGLQATSGVITTGVVAHEPVDKLNTIEANSLANGVYAYVAIKAPNGLSQDIKFKWHQGSYSKTIAASITGGRDDGYRTYSMKGNFPSPATGVWSVDALTAQGQLLEHLEFLFTR